jgi:hypothetical protein
MEWLNTICSFLGGGVCLKIYEEYKNRGKVTITDSNVKVIHDRPSESRNSSIIEFILDLQFANTSGHQKIIQGITIRYFDGKEFQILSIEGFEVKPASVIQPKGVESFQFKLKQNRLNKINTPFGLFEDDKEFLEVTYSIDNKMENLVISPTEFKYEESNSGQYHII